MKKAGWAILVEGERGTQSLWYMGLPAIGVAGASMFKSHQTAALQDLKLNVHKEPDTGGDPFTGKVFDGLKEGGFTGEICLWSCDRLDMKDPSELYLKHGRDTAAQQIKEALKAAERIDLEQHLTPEAAEGAPINLRQAGRLDILGKGHQRHRSKDLQPRHRLPDAHHPDAAPKEPGHRR